MYTPLAKTKESRLVTPKAMTSRQKEWPFEFTGLTVFPWFLESKRGAYDFDVKAYRVVADFQWTLAPENLLGRRFCSHDFNADKRSCLIIAKNRLRRWDLRGAREGWRAYRAIRKKEREVNAKK